MTSIKDATVIYSKGGINKATMPIARLLILSIMAGAFIALAGLASTIASAAIENASVAKIITALVFPTGLVMVVLNGAEIFTGNNLMVISVLDKRITIGGMLKNWLIVYIGNFIGSVCITALCALGHVYSLFDDAVALSTINIAATKCTLSFQDAFIRAIFCNILVCIAVMMALMADNVGGKVIAIFLPILVFVICGFEHSVANMSYISSGIFVNEIYGNMGLDVSGLTWYNFVVSNLVPVTLGNIVGGVLTGLTYRTIGRDNKQ
jgi:formate/nitrite transporter